MIDLSVSVISLHGFQQSVEGRSSFSLLLCFGSRGGQGPFKSPGKDGTGRTNTLEMRMDKQEQIHQIFRRENLKGFSKPLDLAEH